MTLRRLCLSLFAALALKPATALTQSAAGEFSIANVSLLVPADSAGPPTLRLDELALAYQLPWHREVAVALELRGRPTFTRLTVAVYFDLWMGPQAFMGADRDQLDRPTIDKGGQWFRSAISVTRELRCPADCEDGVIVGKFSLDDLVPGADGPQASLWPTRLRVVAQAIPGNGSVRTVRGLVKTRIVTVR